jgi:phage tail-like protein
MTELELPAVVLEAVEFFQTLGPVLLANRSPEPDGTGVPRSTAVVVELFGIVAPIRFDQVEVWIQGAPAYSGSSSPPVSEEFAGPRARAEQMPGGVRIMLDPLTTFVSNEHVLVRFVVRLDGTQPWEATYSFEVEDVTAPRLLAAEAMSPTRVALSFDEPVVFADVGATFELLDVPAVPLQVAGATVDSARVELDVAPPMTPDVRYRVTIAGIRDAFGNPIAAPDNVAVFRGYRPARPTGRYFDLWSMLPRYNRREDNTGDLSKLIACFQEVLDQVLVEIDRFGDILDLERAPEQLVDLMLEEVGNPFSFVLSEVDKRRLAAVLIELYRLKGTEPGIRSAARLFLGIELGAITTYSGSSLILGESLLGIDWELGPSNRFALYAFEVHVPVVLTDEQRARLRALILWSKPAHTHLTNLIEPNVIVIVDEWVLGESELSIHSVLV